MSKPDPVEIDINTLSPYKNNARRHSEHQIELIGKSIKAYGFLKPVLIDDKNMIIAGHGVVEAAKQIGLKLSQVLIWNKNAAVLSRQDYNWKHEPIIYGWKEGAGHYFSNDFSKNTVITDDLDLKGMKKETLLKFTEELLAMVKTTVIDHDRPTRSDLHPTMKPIKLIRDHLEASSRLGEIVLDLFGGAGSTLIAAETSDRAARLMEIDPDYADVIIKRWQEFTGEKAINADTGEAFDGKDD